MVRITTLGMAVMLAGTAVAAQQADDSQVRARQRIAMMEGTLESAVKIGAENLLRQVRSAVPDPPMLAGYPEVHGFRLDGYGIFFDVGVPMLRLPVTWPLRALITSDNRDLESVAAELKQLIAQMDARYQPQFAQAVRHLVGHRVHLRIGQPHRAGDDRLSRGSELRLMVQQVREIQSGGAHVSPVNLAGPKTRPPNYLRLLSQRAMVETSLGQVSGSGDVGTGDDVTTVTRAHSDFLTREAATSQSRAAGDAARSEQLQRLVP